MPADPRSYTDQDVETAVAALQRRSTVPAESGYRAPTPAEMDAWLADRARVVLDALTADGWHGPGRCIQLTAEHWEAMRDAADTPGSVEESKARLAETLRPLGWAPVEETRRDVAEVTQQRDDARAEVVKLRESLRAASTQRDLLQVAVDQWDRAARAEARCPAWTDELLVGGILSCTLQPHGGGWHRDASGAEWMWRPDGPETRPALDGQQTPGGTDD